MANQIYNPAELAHKLEQGTISAEEREWFEHWYANFNDEEVLLTSSVYTAPEQMRDSIFNRISAKIDKPLPHAGKVIPMWRKFAAAAAILLFIGFAALYNTTLRNLINPVQQIQLSSKVSQHKQVQLPDGTRVWLSPATKLSYPNWFNDAQRVVKLEGEAFFEVVHDVQHPFIVQSGKLKTVVLGTSFNVQAYSGTNTAEVTVVSGKVGVIVKSTKQTQQQITVANQRTSYNMLTGALIKENYPDAAKFLDQRNGYFVFKDATLINVCHELELQYGIKILISADLIQKDSRFYGRLNTTDPVQKTLDKLTLVTEAKWINNNGIYQLQESNTY